VDDEQIVRNLPTSTLIGTTSFGRERTRYADRRLIGAGRDGDLTQSR
jgi:hypothetical protein